MTKLRKLLLGMIALSLLLGLGAVLFEIVMHAVSGSPLSLWLTPADRDIQTDFDVTYTVTPDGTRVVCGPEDPKDAREVYFVGDSFTFGQGVADFKDFVGLTSCRFPQFAFYNYGSIGRGLNYYSMVIEQKLPDTALALFIILYENDVVLDRTLFMRDFKDWLYPRSFVATLFHHAKEKVRSLFKVYDADRSPNAKREDRYNSPKAVFTEDPQSLWPVISLSESQKAAFTIRLNRLLASALERNANLRVYMTLIPEAATVSDSHQVFYRSAGATLLPPLGQPSPAYRAASEFCRSHAVCRFIDIFAELRSARLGLYYPSDFHLNERGHRYLADKIFAIISRDLVP